MTINQIKAELLYFYEYTELAKLVGISKSTLEKLNDNTATDITTKLITDFSV